MSSGYANMDTNEPYREPAYSNNHWLEQQEKKGRRSKYIVRHLVEMLNQPPAEHPHLLIFRSSVHWLDSSLSSSSVSQSV